MGAMGAGNFDDCPVRGGGDSDDLEVGMKCEYALSVANDLIERLRPTCERIEVAGSIRRGKAEVKDIELVAIPDPTPPPMPKANFGEKPRAIHKTKLDALLFEMMLEGWMRPLKGGPKYKQIALCPKGLVMPIKLDLFLVTPPAQWGVQMVIRTGPNKPNNNFSQWMVTQKCKGGALPDEYHVVDGCVRMIAQEDYFISMPEEIQFFNFCGLDWIEPKDRVARWSPHPPSGTSPKYPEEHGNI